MRYFFIYEFVYLQLQIQIDHFSGTYPQFTVIIGLSVSEFIICKPNFLVPTYWI